MNPLLVLAALATTWTPPLGIPAPDFGLAELAQAANIWVDNTHPLATDDSPNGAPTKPRKTIPRPLAAGSVVEVRGGPYNYGGPGYIQIVATGTATSPVFLRGVGKPRFSQKIAVFSDGGPDNAYLILEGLDLHRCEILAPAHHIAVRDCEVRGDARSGGLVLDSYSSATVSDVVITRCDIHHNGDWQADVDQDVHGVTVGARSSKVWVVDNTLHHNSGDGVQINAGSLEKQPTTHHIYVGRNVAWENKQTGFWTKQAVDVIFSENTAYAHSPVGERPSAWGAGMGYQYGPERVWFINNHIHHCAFGIQAMSTSGAGSGQTSYFVGNLIHDIRHHAGYPYDPDSAWSNAGMMLVGTPNKVLVNNTIRDSDGGIFSPSPGVFSMANNRMERAGRVLFLEQATVRETTASEVYAAFRAMYGLSLEPAAPVGDLDGDGDVDLNDMGVLLRNATGPQSLGEPN